jgi:phosphomevalonate kinase
MTVRAPGKAMLFGEYAVLDGAPAVVAAVDRYAVARLASDGEAPSPFVAAALRRALERVAAAGRAAPAGLPLVDTSALRAGGRKLGLGSSAAATVAAYGAVLRAAGLALDEKATIYTACAAAHAEAQGAAGSGADVAAAVLGGVLAFTVGAPSTKIAWPAAVEVTLIDTGVAASTGDRVARWRALAAERPDVHRALVEKMAALGRAFLAGPRLDAVEPVRAWNDALDELARAIDLEVVTPAHRRIAERARAVGGAAKPSGAGGGDLAVCFTPPDATGRLRAVLASEGFDVLDLTIGAAGLAPVAAETP